MWQHRISYSILCSIVLLKRQYQAQSCATEHYLRLCLQARGERTGQRGIVQKFERRGNIFDVDTTASCVKTFELTFLDITDARTAVLVRFKVTKKDSKY